jgi:predicted PurR-regulated permease PerM
MSAVDEVRTGAEVNETRLQRQDLGRITLNVLFIAGLLFGSFWVMQPFLPAVLWATTLVLATWPVMKRLEHYAGNRRGVAVLVMTLLILLVLIVPLWLAVSTLVTNLDAVGELARTVLSFKIPPPPGWVGSIPLIGDRAVDAWQKLTSLGVEQLAPRLSPYAGAITQWFASAAGSLGSMLLQFLLTAAISAVMYSGGEKAAATALLFGKRLAGDRGERAVYLAGQAIRSVALGVVVTAVAQAVIGGVGLWVVGLPFAGLLTALMFVLCMIQLGPGLVLIPAVLWMYYTGDAVWATVLLVFTVVATTIDQFIRPILIRRGANLPLLLILSGVVGGLIAFGVLGIFIGPTLLAVTYTLLQAWMNEAVEADQRS